MTQLLTLFLIVLCLPLSVLASEPIQVRPNLKFLPINHQVDVLFDPLHQITLQDVTSAEYHMRFTPHNAQGFNFGMTEDAFWLRLKLDIQPGRSESNGLLLGLDKTAFPEVLLFLPEETGKQVSYTRISGSYLNQTDGQTMRYRYPVFKIPRDLPKNRYLYLYIKPVAARQHVSSNFNLFVSDTDDFIHKTWTETAFYYLVFGVLLSMIVYNLFLSAFLKERVYFLYVGYVTFILIYLFLRSGFHLVAGFPALQKATLQSVAIAYILGVAFSQSFLSTRKYCPAVHAVMWGAIVLSVAVIFLQCLGFSQTANSLMHMLGAIGPTVAIIAGLLRLRQGFTPARYYLAAWFSLLTGVLSLSLVGLGYLPKKFFFFNSLAIGSMAEAILLSTALGDRIRALRQEKRDLQKKERRLIELSITDELTGLFNKRWFSSKLHSEIKHSHRVAQPISLMIIDVDHFKNFNDTYGHSAGDKVLAKLGEIVIDGIREGDIGCRYGGEEFAVILPAADVAKAYNVAERLREMFESAEISVESDKIARSTISIGVAERSPGDNEEQLFDKADRALYKAKQKGRNRTEKAG